MLPISKRFMLKELNVNYNIIIGNKIRHIENDSCGIK